MRDCSRRLYGRKQNGIHAIDDIKHEGRIYWVSDGEGHGGETQQTWVNLGNRKVSRIWATLTRLARTKMAGTAEERYELITRRLQEVLGADIIKTTLADGRTPKCYWGQSFDR